MKVYSVILLQLILWSGYTLLEWLSKHDHPEYNILMFFIFFYLAIILGNYFMKSAKKTLLVTFLSLAIYGSFQLTMIYII
ncbi:hypothetical protein CU633_01610 [Bacillus sp. V3-13]|uniref:hypothetical protein n=1 Tax=Bacillus sp. V3-13 TaxID=2053728 RepID=UPI000C762240|nr:hypothetical protein [Bacillus sp. V3-13]PLR79235.1 hypothetical protein CU633_01610 [Bacillus sp. V3-13]